MLAASLALALALAPSLAADPPRSPSSPPATAAGADLTQESSPAPPAERPTIRRLILQVDAPAPPAAELARALRRRLPELTLDLQADAPSRPPLAPPLGLQAHAAISQLGPEIYGLRLVLADGRAYARVIEAPPADAARALAGALASLIPAIDEADLPADEERAALPAPLAAAVRADLQPPAPPEPLPQPAPRSTDPTPDPTPTPTPTTAPRTPPATPLTILTVSLATGALVAVGPPAAGWRGAPLDLLLARRGPRGLDLALDLRLTPRAFSLNDPEGSRAGEPLRLLRVRLALGVGATLRRRRFEVPLLTLFSVEPWQVRGPEGPVWVVSAADRGPPRPLLGVALRLAPGYRIPLDRGRLHLRVGAHLEAALSGEARPGLPVPRLEAQGAAPFALGGLELFGGLGLALDFAP
ncbi:MAG: hypothetical protein IPK80_19030 [Nannocystis sp.]|nr:hypothetical protein [Nannocystis sp.]